MAPLFLSPHDIKQISIDPNITLIVILALIEQTGLTLEMATGLLRAGGRRAAWGVPPAKPYISQLNIT